VRLANAKPQYCLSVVVHVYNDHRMAMVQRAHSVAGDCTA